MPYVKQEDRTGVDMGMTPHYAGLLNYLLTSICSDYWQKNGQNYQAFNDVLGALEGCKLELYRRMVAPYEDDKLKENGDVYHGKGNEVLRT